MYAPSRLTSRTRLPAALASLGALLLLACPANPSPAAQVGAAQVEPAEPTRGPQFIHAGNGEVSEIVLTERAKTDAADQELVVYVGAHWCEPCQYFHAAVDDGSLDQAFPGLRLLEFDLDHDRGRLSDAGYASRMIPLFVVPGPDGRGGPRRMQGGIKGPGATENIRPRLESLLVAAAADRPDR